MDASHRLASFSRRHLLLAAAAVCAPIGARAAGICTPLDLAGRFEEQVHQKLRLPPDEVRCYAALAEVQLMGQQQLVRAPQYLLVVDSNPEVQAAMVFWRLLPGHLQLVGAAPVSTGCGARPDHFETPQGLFDQSSATAPAPAAACRTAAVRPCSRSGLRVYDFGWQRVREPSGARTNVDIHLQARAADEQAAPLLGRAHSDGCILLPPSLISFLDEFGVLDAGTGSRRAERPQLPYAGRYLLVVDSERGERPGWSPAPV